MGNFDVFLSVIEDAVSAYSRIDDLADAKADNVKLATTSHLRIRAQHLDDFNPSAVRARCRKIAKEYDCELRFDGGDVVFVRPYACG